MRLAILTSTFIALVLSSAPVTARPTLRRIGRGLARPLHAQRVRSLRRAVARPFKSKHIRLLGKGLGKILTVDRALVRGTQTLAARSRRRKAARFDRKVSALAKTSVRRLRIGKRSKKAVTLGGQELVVLQQATLPLIAGMKAVTLGITDPVTGRRRKIERSDLANALRIIRAAGPALSHLQALTIAPKDLSLAKILSDPHVAAAVLRTQAPADQSAFQRHYRAALSTLEALSQAYAIHLTWPGVLSPASKASRGLAAMARGLGQGDAETEALVCVAVRRRTPQHLVEATRILTHKHYGGITHLWLDPLMRGDRGAAKRIKAKLPDAKSRKLVDELIAFRDHGAVQVVAMDATGKRNAKLEKKLHGSLTPLSAIIARKVIRADFYLGASEATKESFTRTVAIGSGIGFAMDGLASVTHNVTINRWKPTVLGGWDDAVGGAINVKEMRDNGHGKKAIVDGAISVGFGLATSAALIAPLLAGGKSIAKLMLDPTTGLASRVFAGGVFGVASSGATLAMSFLPARHYKRPIIHLLESGKIALPTDRKGFPLKGKDLKRWTAKQALKTHLSYTAQKGGLIGVGLSGIVTAGFGIIPGLGGAALANVLLGIGGAGETLTTGAYLFAREALDRRAIDKAAIAFLSKAKR